MAKRRVTWIVMADGSRARIVKAREEGPGFDVVSDLASSEAHLASRDLVSDRPGHSQESGNPAHHAIEPRHDPHEQVKTAFLRSVAERLNDAAGKKAFDQLILFAPPRCLGELREALDDKTLGKIKASAPKDLTKLPLAELPGHLDALIPR
jgi:protein required for attachment to host cells